MIRGTVILVLWVVVWSGCSLLNKAETQCHEGKPCPGGQICDVGTATCVALGADLVVPVFDELGHVTEVYGRKITPNVNPPWHLYLPGPHRGVWNERGLVGQAEVLRTEALIDAMTFWCAGYRNVTAAYGVEGLTDDHLAAFKRCGVKRVLIAFDRDDAGERGAEKAAERLMAAGIECYRVQFPKGMDANEYALKVTPADKSLGLVIRKAAWLGKGTPPAEAPGQHVEGVVLPAAAAEPTPTEPASSVEPSSLAADAVAPPPAADIAAEVSDDEVIVSFGDRRWRVRGLAKNLSAEVLKVNVLASKGEAYHVDSFDLYAARARAHYITQAAKELACREDVIKLDLGRVLLKLETLQAERIKFFPLLPDWKLNALGNLVMGHAEKVGFSLKRDIFAGLNPHFAMLNWDGAPTTGFLCKPFDRQMVTMFASGPYARDLFAQGADAAIAEGKSLLAKIFGADVLKEIAATRATNWVTDPHILGAYSVLRPGGGEARAELARPIENRVFFAGEATSTDGFSTAHGAYNSGLTAVDEIKRALA